MAAHSELLRADPRSSALPGAGFAAPKEKAREDAEEECCPAFGYLRGVRDRALALEVRLRNGNHEWFPYHLLGRWSYNPSVGLLLRFSGENTTLVLVHGSNLAAPVNHGATNLTDRGIQRHRVTWIREMEQAELRAIGEKEPTIDRIDVAEFDSSEAIKEWLARNAGEFLRK